MPSPVDLLLAAAPPTIWEQIKRVPKETWINIILFVVVIVVMIRAWKALKKLNDFAPYIAMTLFGFGIFGYWVYERTEPRILTPIVDRLAPFFPSKSKQDEISEKRRRGRDV